SVARGQEGERSSRRTTASKGSRASTAAGATRADGETRGVVGDGARDVEARGELEAFEPRTGVDLEDLRPALSFEKVHAGDVEPEHACGANGRLRVRGRDVDRRTLRA